MRQGILTTFYRMIRESLSDKVVFEQRPDRSEGISHADISWMIFLGRGLANAKILCGSLQISRDNKEARVSGAE